MSESGRVRETLATQSGGMQVMGTNPWSRMFQAALVVAGLTVTGVAADTWINDLEVQAAPPADALPEEIPNPPWVEGDGAGEGVADELGPVVELGDARGPWWSPDFTGESTSVLGPDNPLDESVSWLFSPKDRLGFPVSVGMWNWWNIDTGGVGNGGYGAKNFRGTYAYYVIAQPEWKLNDDGEAVGASMFLAGRDGDYYRPYYTQRFWFLEGYAYLKTQDYGTFKGGLVNRRFGLGNYLGFIGSAPYFNGFQQNPDAGFSWERTGVVYDDFTIDTFAQYFVQQAQWNGGLPNQNPETVDGLREQNIFIVRVVPKWILPDGSTLATGASAMSEQVDSNLAGFEGNHRSVMGLDADYVKGPLNLRGEWLIWNGRTVPTLLASGGPSDQVTSYAAEAAYTIGPVKYRGMYSENIASNPGGRETIWTVGTVSQMTPHVRLFVEYANWTVAQGATNADFPIIQGVQMVLHWNF